jgi:hypothetical protein
LYSKQFLVEDTITTAVQKSRRHIIRIIPGPPVLTKRTPENRLELRTVVQAYTVDMERLTTAKLASEGGVNVETIPYYERHGLLRFNEYVKS